MNKAKGRSGRTLNYKDAGVNYEGLDAFKIACIERAHRTARNASRLGIVPLEWTRGESCYVVSYHGLLIGFVVETLGTKNVAADNFRWWMKIADRLANKTGKRLRTYYDKIMKSVVRVNTNDLAPLGISPVCVGMHAALSSDDFLKDEERAHDIVEGFAEACDEDGCIWSGGETPGLGVLVRAGAGIFSGASWGVSKTGRLIDSRSIEDEDVITLVASSGLHDNGVSLARKIIDNLPRGYLTPLPSGRLCGDALLEETFGYSRMTEELLDNNVILHGAVNVTGHGFLKFKRPRGNFTYVFDELLPCPEILSFLGKHGPISPKDLYETFNMGVGFAYIHPRSETPLVKEVLHKYKDQGINSLPAAGFVKKSRRKNVIIRPVKTAEFPKGLELRDHLAIRK